MVTSRKNNRSHTMDIIKVRRKAKKEIVELSVKEPNKEETLVRKKIFA